MNDLGQLDLSDGGDKETGKWEMMVAVIEHPNKPMVKSVIQRLIRSFYLDMSLRYYQIHDCFWCFGNVY